MTPEQVSLERLAIFTNSPRAGYRSSSVDA
jgi:hypothetical protein